jgi:hypothetical protein
MANHPDEEIQDIRIEGNKGFLRAYFEKFYMLIDLQHIEEEYGIVCDDVQPTMYIICKLKEEAIRRGMPLSLLEKVEAEAGMCLNSYLTCRDEIAEMGSDQMADLDMDIEKMKI